MLNNSLIQASINGNLNADSLIHQGTDLNAKGDKGWTALHNAAYYSQTAIADLLVRNGANVNLTGDGGTTALMNSAYSGSFEISRLLVENGANINAKDSYSWTPLLFALIFKNGKTNRNEIITYLLSNGADINVKNSAGWTAIMKTINENETELTRTLINYGANVNDRYIAEGGISLLLRAISKNNLEIAKLLISNGADVNAKLGNLTAMSIISDQLSKLTSLWKPERMVDGSPDEIIQVLALPVVCKPYIELLKLLKSKGAV